MIRVSYRRELSNAPAVRCVSSVYYEPGSQCCVFRGPSDTFRIRVDLESAEQIVKIAVVEGYISLAMFTVYEHDVPAQAPVQHL